MIIQTDYPYPVRFVTLREGQKIAYVKVGNGTKTLVFVHGFASFLPVWEKNMEQLQKYYTCIALDLPGHGLSSSEDYPYSMSFYAQIVGEFVEQLALKDIVLIGHSMGGQISVHLALQNPALLSHLILVAPAGFETFTEPEKFFLSSMISTGLVQAAQYFKNLYNLKDYFFELDEKEYAKLQEFSRDFYSLKENPNLLKVLARSSTSMLNEPIFEKLKNLEMPAMVSFGKQDRLIPNRMIHHESTEKIAQRGAAQIKHCTLKLYDKGGHFIQYEQAAQLNIDIYKFLKPDVFE